jgi:hypothetical protein
MERFDPSSEKIEFKEYYQTADIVIFSEAVHGIHKKEICLFLDHFHDVINGIFLEFTPDIQESFEVYLEQGVIDSQLQRVFDGAYAEGKEISHETLAILDKAREYELEIVCFDARKRRTDEFPRRSPTGGVWFVKGTNRDEDMYTNVKEYVARKPGKYLVIVGGGHISSEMFEGKYRRFGPLMAEHFGDRCTIIKPQMGSS